MGLIRWGLLALACGVVGVIEADASFPGKNGSIVYVSGLLPAPDSGIVELRLAERPRRRSLTAKTGISGLLPAESPDGRLLAYVRVGHVYVADRDGRHVRDLGRGGRPSWSPDGRELAYSVWDPYQTVVVADVATGERRALGYGSNPSWSPDGSRLAFVHSEGVGVVDTDGSNRRFLWRQTMPTWLNLDAPVWSPDGRLLAFSAADPDLYEGSPHAEGVVVVDLSGGTVVAGREWARHPRWSPSGATLVYVRTRGRKSTKEIVRIDIGSRTVRVIATVPFAPKCEGSRALGSLAFGADFSPGGDRIAFASGVRRNGRCRVALWIVDGVGRVRIVHTEATGTRAAGFTADDVVEVGPRWLRDGSGLWFGVERRTLRPELYLRREDGTGIRRLTRSTAAEQDPRFSPDGRRIVFVRGKRGRDGVIWITDSGGRRPRMLGPGSYPTWSPDGKRMAFTRGNALYTMSAAGGRSLRLVRAPVTMPAWSPDGREIAFVRAGVAIERDPYEARSGGLFSVEVKTRRVRRLTRAVGLFPNWSPDGRLIAYTLWDVGPTEADQLKSDRYPFLRLVTRGGEDVDLADRYVFSYDVAWAPSGDRLVSAPEHSALMRIGPPFRPEASNRVPAAPLPGLLGIRTEERDPDWQAGS